MTSTVTETTSPIADQPRPLSELFTGHPERQLCVRLGNGHEGVVTRSHHSDNVFLLAPGTGQQISEVSAWTSATAVTDPEQCRHLLSQALTAVSTQYADDRVTFEQFRKDAHTYRDDIRIYAIARHRSGEICRDGLDRFLKHFDMDSYEPQVRVRFTITGSLLVNSSDVRTVRHDVRDSLEVNFDGVDDYDDHSGEADVCIDECSEVDDD